jgi:hypothetical protein
MRTTLDLPDPVFRDLKIRAAQQGVKLKELVERYIVDGLERPIGEELSSPVRSALPVFRMPGSSVNPSFSNAELQAILDEEEFDRHEKIIGR